MKNYLEVTGSLSKGQYGFSFSYGENENSGKDVAKFIINYNTKTKINDSDQYPVIIPIHCTVYGAPARMMKPICEMTQEQRQNITMMITVSGRVSFGYVKTDMQTQVKSFDHSISVFCDDVEILDNNYKLVKAGQSSSNNDNSSNNNNNNSNNNTGQFGGNKFGGGQFGGGQFGGNKFGGGQFGGGKFNNNKFNSNFNK